VKPGSLVLAVAAIAWAQASAARAISSADCQALGMTRQKMREGPCTHGGVKVYVANRHTEVHLREMDLRLNGFGVQAARHGKASVVLSLTVTNHLRRRVAFDAGSTETSLHLGRHVYVEDRRAEDVPGPSFAWRNAGIKPGRTATGTVVFRIPRSLVRRLSTIGNLVVTQFTDAGRARPRERIAVLRTYR
jgi:hypothetical protein